MLKGYGLLAGVERMGEKSGPWDEPGSHRTLYMTGGGDVTQTVVAADRPEYFAYRVTDFAPALALFSPAALSEWHFVDRGPKTELRWTYTHEMASMPAAIAFWPLIRYGWEGYMAQIIDNIRRHANAQL